MFFFFPYFNKNETLLSPRSFDLFSEFACDDEIEPLFKLGIQNAQSVFPILLCPSSIKAYKVRSDTWDINILTHKNPLNEDMLHLVFGK